MTKSASVARLSEAAVRPLRTLDPTAPLDDLEWLDEAIGGARVVAIGESAHYNHESYLLRHRLLRYLVERHGFGAYAMESGFVEGWLVHDWVRGGATQLDEVLATGVTSLMGLWTEMRAHLEWMRQHNRSTAPQVDFYGIDLPGSNISLLPGLEAVLAYLTQADPEFEVDSSIRDMVADLAAPSAFSATTALAGYEQLGAGRRDALTAGLGDLAARLVGRRLEYVRRTSAELYARALHSMRLTITLNTAVRAMSRGDRQEIMFERDAAQADSVEWILDRTDRIVLAAHNGHVQRWPIPMPGTPPATPLGMHLADRLGEHYRVIGMTTGSGQALNTDPTFYEGVLFADLQAPRPGSLDALMDTCHDGPFATDLRRLSPADTATLRAVTEQRQTIIYTEVNPVDAFDVLVHLPHVTAAQPDAGALARSPEDVRQAYSRWMARGTSES